jgi:hypothetical protein
MWDMIIKDTRCMGGAATVEIYRSGSRRGFVLSIVRMNMLR